jgi:integrase
MRNDFKRHLDHATCNMSLDELAARFPNVTKGLFKLRDGGGLFLEVTPTGARGWRFYYQRPITKKPNTISFGPFPAVSLSDARTMRDNAAKDVANGIDPSASKQEGQRSAAKAAADVVTFLAFTNFEQANDAGEIVEGAFWKFYMSEKRKDGSPKCAQTIRCEKIRLRTLQKALGPLPVASINSGEVQAILDGLADDGFLNKAHRVQQLAVRVFDLAVARRLCKYNVAAPCKNAIVKQHSRKRAAVTDQILEVGLDETERRVGKLLRDIRDYPGRLRLHTRKALEMMMFTFPRPANVVGMEWSEIEGDMWTIPKHKMKMRRVHKVPLSRQALAVLDTMRKLTGDRVHVFPGNKESMTRALIRMGYDTDNEQSVHGMRSIASTLLNEGGEFTESAIELQLAHEVGSKRERGERRGGTVKGKYDLATRMDERKALMAWWGDYLDRLRDGNVVQLRNVA